MFRKIAMNKLKMKKVASAVVLTLLGGYAICVRADNLPQDTEDFVVKDSSIQLVEGSHDDTVGYITVSTQVGHGSKSVNSIRQSNFSIETKRAGLIPLQYLNNPKASRIAVDVRILDGDGNPIFTQISGHGPADPTWLPYEPIVTNTDELVERSQRVFAALPSVLPRYAEKLKSLGLDPEQQALSNLQKLTQYSLAKESMDSHEKAASSLVTQTIEIWRGSVGLGSLGEHSATLLKASTASGQILTLWSLCNHGTAAGGCPGSTGMTKKCSKGFSNRPPVCPAFTTECNTPWGVNISSSYHVCNDDSYIQYQAVKSNSNPSMATCASWGIRAYAPSCD